MAKFVRLAEIRLDGSTQWTWVNIDLVAAVSPEGSGSRLRFVPSHLDLPSIQVCEDPDEVLRQATSIWAVDTSQTRIPEG